MPSKKTELVKIQDWWFLREQMRSNAYSQTRVEYKDILKTELTLEQCLERTGAKNASDFSFFIHSASMAAAVQLLSDESIITTYNLYCTNDPVVIIIIRNLDELSPNTSRAPSHSDSLREGRKVSGPRGLLTPELVIQSAPRNISKSLDLYTMENVEAENAVTLCIENDHFVKLSKEYLFGKTPVH
jgi:hypothetical protein